MGRIGNINTEKRETQNWKTTRICTAGFYESPGIYYSSVVRHTGFVIAGVKESG